ncbi:hypothetical protein DQG23_28125 [Paenibacillus contaminans]|uniref:Uncharacterized protein n=1 Tax=Paenibacillus contaminans TaxID=450362 RepID=A0A329MH70_9BACL|nr:hypothetical protein DQG23_28125 [Paenibacillus contaminans]
MGGKIDDDELLDYRVGLAFLNRETRILLWKVEKSSSFFVRLRCRLRISTGLSQAIQPILLY